MSERNKELNKERLTILREWLEGRSGSFETKEDKIAAEGKARDEFGPGSKGMNEFIDRVNCIQTMVEQLIENHPTALLYEQLFKDVRNISDMLMFLYQISGEFDAETPSSEITKIRETHWSKIIGDNFV